MLVFYHLNSSDYYIMKGKYIEKSQAIEMRKKGLQIKDIAENLGVSKGTVSVWVRHIELSAKQICELQERKITFLDKGREKGSKKLKEKYGEIRANYREVGRQVALECIAKNNSSNHLKSCLLYWAEGTKNRNRFEFTNSDPIMIKIISDFLLSECFNLKQDDIKMSLNCYDDIHSIEEIEVHWDNIIGFKTIKKKHIVKKSTCCPDQGRHNKYPYGVCRLTVNKTEVVQHVYGALEVYVGAKIDPL